MFDIKFEWDLWENGLSPVLLWDEIKIKRHLLKGEELICCDEGYVYSKSTGEFVAMCHIHEKQYDVDGKFIPFLSPSR